MNSKKHRKSHITLYLLVCLAAMLLLPACGKKNKKDEEMDGRIPIEPQVIYSQNGVTATPSQLTERMSV